MPFSAMCEGWRGRSGGGGRGGGEARTGEKEGLQLAERSYGRRHLPHRVGTTRMTVKVQEDDVGAGLQPAHKLHQLIAPQLPEAFLLFTHLKFSVLPAAAVLAQVYVKREGEGGVEHQLQVLHEGHGRQGEVALPKVETVNTQRLRWRGARHMHVFGAKGIRQQAAAP
jgi:hypothetical protein